MMVLLLSSELSFGTPFSLLEAEDDYVESLILLQNKNANYRANTEFNL